MSCGSDRCSRPFRPASRQTDFWPLGFARPKSGFVQALFRVCSGFAGPISRFVYWSRSFVFSNIPASFRIFRLSAEFREGRTEDGESFRLSWALMLPRPPLFPRCGWLILQVKKAVTQAAAKLFSFSRHMYSRPSGSRPTDFTCGRSRDIFFQGPEPSRPSFALDVAVCEH